MKKNYIKFFVVIAFSFIFISNVDAATNHCYEIARSDSRCSVCGTGGASSECDRCLKNLCDGHCTVACTYDGAGNTANQNACRTCLAGIGVTTTITKPTVDCNNDYVYSGYSGVRGCDNIPNYSAQQACIQACKNEGGTTGNAHKNDSNSSDNQEDPGHDYIDQYEQEENQGFDVVTDKYSDPYENERIGDSFCDTQEIIKGLKVIGMLLFVAKIFIPIIVIGLGVFDIYKSINAGSSEDLLKQSKVLLIRIFVGILIFFFPAIIRALFSLDSSYNSLENDNFNCFEAVLNPMGIEVDSSTTTSNTGSTTTNTNVNKCGNSCGTYSSKNSCEECGCYWNNKNPYGKQCVNARCSNACETHTDKNLCEECGCNWNNQNPYGKQCEKK